MGEASSTVYGLDASTTFNTIVFGDDEGLVHAWTELLKVPLMLAAEVEAEGLAITCSTMGDSCVHRFTGVSVDDPLAALLALIGEQVPPREGSVWQVVLPDMSCAEGAQHGAALRDLFGV